MDSSIQHNLRAAEIKVYLQSALLGIVLAECWCLSQFIGTKINDYITASHQQEFALLIFFVSIFLGILYLFERRVFSILSQLVRSKRLDLFVLLMLGIVTSVSVNGIGAEYYQKYVTKVPVILWIFLVTLPLVIVALQGAALALLLLKIGINNIKKKLKIKSDQPSPFFISDQDIKSKQDDLLNLSDRAEKFAELVLNGGASDSLVFGIDAPWGIGKSSFINFCCEYWRGKAAQQIIVHRFEPLRYEDNADLAGRFVNDLVNTIQKHAFVPSIRPIFSKYSRLIKGTSDFSLFGLRFEPSADTVEDTLENLAELLSERNWKIIVVVDDLDRLSWSAIKNILFAIKRSFMLPNVSYVLCYETENIISSDSQIEDVEKVKEFLEKFVNVKISLFLDSSALRNYVSNNFQLAVKNNLQIDSRLLDQIKSAINELVKIYDSDEFNEYQNFIGDIRKLKRLINTVILFEIEKIDYKNSDFNRRDLLNLLLVYLNYPSVFRKIYNAEANGKNGFFSWERKYAGGRVQFANSIQYDTYIAKLDPHPLFLVKAIFDVQVRSQTIKGEEFNEGERTSRACFNDGPNRNLERYLNLIVNQSQPSNNRDSYRFFVNMKDDLASGLPISDVLSKDEFSLLKGDFSHSELWRVISNSVSDFGPAVGAKLISYLLENLPEYSTFNTKNTGSESRKNLVYALLKLINAVGWGDENNGRRNNSAANVAEIAERIFGENKYKGFGLLEIMTKPNRGPLGFYDVLIFRLYCSADRGGNFFDLQRALSQHGDMKAPTEGSTVVIAREGMREISQTIFEIFNEQYIVTNINIFDAIDKLSSETMAGQFIVFINEQIKENEISENELNELKEVEKSSIKSFIIYQLGNSVISSGVGCGFYDEEGNEDQKGIAKKINEYLFEFCFNPSVSLTNFECFLDYLLTQFSHSFGQNFEQSYIPNIDEFVKVLDKERLMAYWRENRTEILAQNFVSREKYVRTSGYTADYRGDLPNVYKLLDDLI